MGIRATLRSLWDPTAELRPLLAAVEEDAFLGEAGLQGLRFQLKQRLGMPLSGSFQGLFKGQGMDFLGLREYQPGDEIRKMDWNVLARTGVPHIRQHFEERQLPVWFWVDATAPMFFGQTRPKLAYARSLMAMLGVLALEAGHRVGLILWQGEAVPQVIPPMASSAHLERCLQTLTRLLPTADTAPQTTPLALPDVGKLLPHRAMLFLLSDFSWMDTPHLELAGLMRHLHNRHAVSALVLTDPVEADLLYGHGWLPLQDNARRETVWLDTADRWAIKAYRQSFRRHQQHHLEQLRRWVRVLPAQTDTPPLSVVARWVKGAAL